MRDKNKAADLTVRDKNNEEVAQGESYGTLIGQQYSSAARQRISDAFASSAKENSGSGLKGQHVVDTRFAVVKKAKTYLEIVDQIMKGNGAADAAPSRKWCR